MADSIFRTEAEKALAKLYQLDENAILKNINSATVLDEKVLVASPFADKDRSSRDHYVQSIEFGIIEIIGANPIPPIGQESIFNSKKFRIDSRKIEENIEILSDIVSTMRSIKADYDVAAANFVRVRDHIEEFYALQFIHSKEVRAGIYNNPFDKADREYKALCHAADKSQERVNLYNIEMSKYYTDDQIKLNQSFWNKPAEYINADSPYIGTALKHTRDIIANGNKSGMSDFGAVLSNSVYLEKRREDINKITFDGQQLSLDADLKLIISKRDNVKIDRKYLKKDIKFKSERNRVANDIANRQALEFGEVNGPINFREKMDSYASRWIALLPYAIFIARLVHSAIRELGYSQDYIWPEPRAGSITESLVKWLETLKIDQRVWRQNEQISRYSKWIKRMSNAKEIIAKISLEDLGSNNSTYLRGISVEFVGDNNFPIQLEISPPSAAISTMPLGGQATSPSTLHIGRVCKPEFATDGFKVFSESLWNGVPYGDWKIDLLDTYSVSAVQMVGLHFWVVRR